MQNSICIMQNILRADRPSQVAGFIKHPAQAQEVGDPLGKARGQVGEQASLWVRVQVERKVDAAAAIEKVVIAESVHAEYQIPGPATHEAGPADTQGVVRLP